MLILTAIVVAGCTGGEPEPLPPEMQQAAAPTAATAPAQPQPSAPSAQDQPATATPPAAETPLAQPAAPPVAATPQPAAMAQPISRQSEEDEQWATQAEQDGVRKKAGVGMGQQGHGYGHDPITYPLAAYFRIRERIGIDQIKHAVDLYKALHGHYPRTQDEFRKEIIKASAIRLPTLPAGEKYLYDPDKGELMVLRMR